MTDANLDTVENTPASHPESEPEQVANHVEIVDPASLEALPGRFLKRAEVAERLGLSLSSVRRMEGSELTPVIGRNGVRYFAESDIEAVFVRVRQTRRVDEEQVRGVLAARVFEQLERGSDVVEIVKTLGIAPELAEELAKQRTEMLQTFELDRDAVLAIANVLSVSELTGADDVLRAAAEFKQGAGVLCALCERDRAALCRSCAQRAGIAALREEEARKLY